MADRLVISLRDGTLVRHKTQGYEGKIEGTTAIKTCFTRGGDLLQALNTKEAFQYRVAVNGLSMRHIAPFDDLEIIEAVEAILCDRCHQSFYTKPGLTDKACGRCACGAWICPVCLGCQSEEAANDPATSCATQRKRFVRKTHRR